MGGFVGCGSPEYLLSALRRRFDHSDHPRQLHVIIVSAAGNLLIITRHSQSDSLIACVMQVASTGNRKGGGADCLAAEGLLAKCTFGWTGERGYPHACHLLSCQLNCCLPGLCNDLDILLQSLQFYLQEIALHSQS